MKKTLLILCAAAAASSAALAQGTTSATRMTVARLYDGQLRSIESEVVPLIQAMPAGKFDFAPTNGEFKGVRTFAQQAKHLAAVIFIAAAAANQEKPPVDTGGEAGPDSAATKEQIVQFVKDAFSYAHSVMATLTSENELDMVPSPFGSGTIARGAIAAATVWHSFDHYGQMVVYLRMNGIVPPASRGQ